MADSDSGGMSAMVAIIAIIAILAIGYFVIQMLPANGTGSDASINVDLPGGNGEQ
jgi:hypothetical protein